MDKIKEKLSLLTTEPGCYLMKNVDGKIIYVGKAKNLKEGYHHTLIESIPAKLRLW